MEWENLNIFIKNWLQEVSRDEILEFWEKANTIDVQLEHVERQLKDKNLFSKIDATKILDILNVEKYNPYFIEKYGISIENKSFSNKSQIFIDDPAKLTKSMHSIRCNFVFSLERLGEPSTPQFTLIYLEDLMNMDVKDYLEYMLLTCVPLYNWMKLYKTTQECFDVLIKIETRAKQYMTIPNFTENEFFWLYVDIIKKNPTRLSTDDFVFIKNNLHNHVYTENDTNNYILYRKRYNEYEHYYIVENKGTYSISLGQTTRTNMYKRFTTFLSLEGNNVYE